MSGLHVVLGGSGAAGGALVRELQHRGKQVRGVSRHLPNNISSGIEWPVADISDSANLRTALEGASVVYHCAQPEYTRWPEEFPVMNTKILEAVQSVGARLVFADNLYTYESSLGAINEKTAEIPVSKKGAVRLKLAEQLLEWHRTNRVEVSIARGANYYGPGVIGSSVGKDFFERIANGKPAQWAGRNDQPHALTFIDDFARALALLGEMPGTSGRVWVIPTAEALTIQEFANLIAETAGKTATRSLSTMPSWILPMLGLFVPILREIHDVRYQMERPFTVDGREFANAFNFAPTAHREAIRATLESLRTTQLLAIV